MNDWLLGVGVVLLLILVAFLVLVYRQGREHARKLDETHLAMNSRMSALLEQTVIASRLEGREAQRTGIDEPDVGKR